MTKLFSVYILENAERDIDDVYVYVKRNDSEEKAERLFLDIEQTILSLQTSPVRGHYPPELERLGIREYREIY